MLPQFWIFLLIGLSVLGAIASVWQWANLKGYKARAHRKSTAGKKKRSTDKRKLNRLEKKQYKQARSMIAKGKHTSAAILLEQLLLHREAIQTLEDSGHFDEAAAILMRMQRPNRAGVVYARHGLWIKAAECFRIANMPAEVGKCAREAGNHKLAAEFFAKSERFGDAADSYRHSGNFREAGQHYLLINEHKKAMSMYKELVKVTKHLHGVEFSANELNAIAGWLIAGNFSKELASIIVIHNRGVETVMSLIRAKNIKIATEIYSASATTNDLGPALMAEINYQTEEAPILAQLFYDICSFSYAGMIYEQMKAFDKAADAFEKAGDTERAAYCYERCGNQAKAAEMKSTEPNVKRTVASGGPAAFSLEANKTKLDFDAEEDGTAVLVEAEAVSTTEHAAPPPPPNSIPVKLEEPKFEVENKAAGVTPPPPASPVTTNFSLSSANEESPIDELGPTVPSVPPQENPYAEPPRQENPAEYNEFSTSALISILDDNQKRELWDAGVTKTFENNTVVYSCDNKPEGLYFITSGAVNCYRDLYNRDATFMSRYDSSASFGELFTLADHPMSINIVADGPVSARIITPESFQKLLDKNGTIARKLYKSFTIRLINRFSSPENDSENQEAS